MKQRIIVSSGFLFLWILCSQAFSTVEAQENYQITFRDKIFALHSGDEKSWWAVGNMGLILKTTDGGETWSKIEPISDRALNDVVFIEESGWIVGEGGLILHTEDGGIHWEEQVSNAAVSLMGVYFLDNQRGIIVGDGGTVIWTEDGGSTWETCFLDLMEIIPENVLDEGIFSLNFYDVFFVDEAHGWIVGDAGTVLFSSDGGKNWQVLRIGLYPPLYSLFFKNHVEGLAAGHSGVLLHTEDGGKNWDTVNTPTEANLFKVEMLGGYGVIVGNLGTVLLTVNGGKSWDVADLGLSPPLPWFLDVGIIPDTSSKGIICAGQGLIKKYFLKKCEEKS